MVSIVINLALLALHVWLSAESYKNEKHEASMIHSFGAGVHFGFFLISLIDYLNNNLKT